MRRFLLSSLCVLGLGFAAPMAAHADDNAKLCPLYGKIGGAMSDFMLPLTVQELVNMISGRDQDLAAQMTGAFVKSMTQEELIALSELGPGEAELFGQSSGMVAVELLMSGQATSGADVRRAMERSCNQVGIRTILTNQKLANDAQSANMGQ